MDLSGAKVGRTYLYNYQRIWIYLGRRLGGRTCTIISGYGSIWGEGWEDVPVQLSADMDLSGAKVGRTYLYNYQRIWIYLGRRCSQDTEYRTPVLAGLLDGKTSDNPYTSFRLLLYQLHILQRRKFSKKWLNVVWKTSAFVGLLPPASEEWREVRFSQVCVCPTVRGGTPSGRQDEYPIPGPERLGEGRGTLSEVQMGSTPWGGNTSLVQMGGTLIPGSDGWYPIQGPDGGYPRGPLHPGQVIGQDGVVPQGTPCPGKVPGQDGGYPRTE